MILHQSEFPLCLISSEGFRNNKDAVIGAIIQSLSFAKSKVTSVLLFLNRLSNMRGLSVLETWQKVVGSNHSVGTEHELPIA